jgi:hypothetical protein
MTPGQLSTRGHLHGTALAVSSRVVGDVAYEDPEEEAGLARSTSMGVGIEPQLEGDPAEWLETELTGVLQIAQY